MAERSGQPSPSTFPRSTERSKMLQSGSGRRGRKKSSPLGTKPRRGLTLIECIKCNSICQKGGKDTVECVYCQEYFCPACIDSSGHTITDDDDRVMLEKKNFHPPNSAWLCGACVRASFSGLINNN